MSVLQHARDMRRTPTRAEQRMWCWLRDRRFEGHKFRRQHVVGPYILDFYCPALRIAIELDGQHHAASWMAEYESNRTEYLNARGIRVIRISNDLFVRDSVMVEEMIRAAIEERS